MLLSSESCILPTKTERETSLAILSFYTISYYTTRIHAPYQNYSERLGCAIKLVVAKHLILLVETQICFLGSMLFSTQSKNTIALYYSQDCQCGQLY